ncbi:hypothetical protein XELAEV_18031683mg [Xenopus laevis]|uniref:RING-type E3 ubiquitin transferase n=1 Tax=Xenopus laevis TaxID=8355 RepID=A0A974CQE9_XENLA|nr:hypothetical protein XELAEV_18031683mg [Xenopus laevis]
MEGVQRYSTDYDNCIPERGTNNEHSTEEIVPPDYRCPVCLNRFNDVAYLDVCKHKFCFLCIETWIQENGSCPLCRQPVGRIEVCEPDGRNEEEETPNPSQIIVQEHLRNGYEVLLLAEDQNLAVGGTLNNDQEVPLHEVGDGPAINLAVVEEGLARNFTSETNESHRWSFKCNSTWIFGACFVIMIIALGVGVSFLPVF